MMKLAAIIKILYGNSMNRKIFRYQEKLYRISKIKDDNNFYSCPGCTGCIFIDGITCTFKYNCTKVTDGNEYVVINRYS